MQKEILLSLLPAIRIGRKRLQPLRDANSACHREAIEAVEILPAQVQDIGELLDASTQSE